MKYRDALRYLYRLTDYEKKGFAAYAPEFYNLDRIRQLLEYLGNPERRFRIVHIAGTKGKGSTAAMTAGVLKAAGFRTALYTSPHLHTFRERIQLDGELIPEAEVAGLVEEMQPLVAKVSGITTFEVMTALAFVWFARQHAEWAVLEVGLGGRLDATNVVSPDVSVITSISLDHTAILGDTVAQIAAEKAGIIKPGVPVVSSPQVPEAQEVIESFCLRHDARLTLVGREWTWRSEHVGLDRQSFTAQNGKDLLQGLYIPLLGDYQVVNAVTAVACLWVLRSLGVKITRTALRRGLRSIRWPGRLEILSRRPWLVADCAHNGDSAHKVMRALREHLAFKKLVLVLGASADHVTPELLNAFLSSSDRAIATKSRHPRAADPLWLQGRAQRLGYGMETSASVPEALAMAVAGASAGDLVLCTGSVFVAAEARAAWFKQKGLAQPPSDPF